MRVPKRGQKGKIAKKEKSKKKPRRQAIQKHPIWMQVSPGPWAGNFALRGISRENFVLGGTTLIGQGLARQYGTASRLTRRLRPDGITFCSILISLCPVILAYRRDRVDG
ncbi:hypothetical protein M752DRAFT_7579 [Aspergillus phoenicis ATCC 13157]|uniref:Uncharacterized protein n=1 Tax=Aspergillus phoenicis ATCC 13157 TaxID=1353007 RepID=A0A370Q0C9_ASPPH|nr:hypothetical protein M752DRAFT_7579 [Aspergillus phoenicis ATCC 13157]